MSPADDSRRAAVARRTRGRGGAARHPLGLGHAGPRGRGLRARVRGGRRRAARLRGLQLHDGAAPGAAGAGRGARRRGGDGEPFVHRHRERRPLLRRAAGVRGRRAGHLQHRSRTGSRRRSRTAPRRSCSCTSWACPATWPVRRAGRAARRGRDRGRGLRDRQRDALDGAWQRIGRPHGDVACFSFHPRKLLSTGDGGMLTTARAGPRRALPAAAPARHERARHRAPRLAGVVFE